MNSQNTHPLFEVVTTTAGAISIRNKDLNEIMHNPVGPWKEANALYIEPSGLVGRLSQKSNEPFVLFDVGLGAAANSLAALHCYYRHQAARPLRLISFEKDLELLRFALGHAEVFEHFRGYEEAMTTLLEKGIWESGPVQWILREGNFLTRIQKETERPHLIFYDPYSMTVNSEMWTVDCFRLIRKLCRQSEEGGTLLLNYSRATPFRSALFLAGFAVGKGPATGLKDETTQAATSIDLLSEPLGAQWLQRWERSHTKMPPESTPEQWPDMESFIRGHAQLRSRL